ncbi:type IV secretory system conjugative DNA transfer family protein [Amycolatopsis sp. lyj-23]|uniref:type IV secretory system conjugative DNA transfer family protein n=1 Tax=Amycolatopsis sp. lyj-23 TaxID=2789283 RepID=UPI00397BFAD8
MSDDKDARKFERRLGATGVIVGGFTGVMDAIADPAGAFTPLYDMAAPVAIPAGVLAVGAAIGHNRWYFSERQTLRRNLGDDGWVTPKDLSDFAGAKALYKSAEFLRPDLQYRTGRTRRRQAPTEYGFDLGKLASGHRPVRGKHVYSPYGRSMLLLGPQGSGKSQMLINQILDFPGAEYVASTKLELFEATAELRAQRGKVWLFNPTGLGGVPSTFFWDPVSGCRNQAVADARAWALVRGGGGAEGIDRSDFWARKAQEIIRCYLLAAALMNWDMGAVHYWATNPDDTTPVGILQANPDFVPAGWIGTLQSSLDASHNTRTGYFATVVSCVGFMDNPHVAAACRPRPQDNFDMAEFLASGTLYAVGSETDRRLAPLLTALTEHIFTSAKQAAAMVGGRLPLGLAMLLDEVAQQTPVPLPQWSADSRGANILVEAVVQSLAQMRMTWGDDGEKIIFDNLPTKVILGGISNEDDLRRLAFLARTRMVADTSESENHNSGGGKSRGSSKRMVREQVLRPEVLGGLPMGYAFVTSLNWMRAGIVKYEPGRKRIAREMKELESAQGTKTPQVQWEQQPAPVDNRVSL